MDFDWSEEQKRMYDECLSFARAFDRAKGFSKERWARCGDFGLLGLSVPEHDGGAGLGALASARMLEAFGRGSPDLGLAFSASAHLFACAMPIAEHGGEEVRRELLPGLAQGRLVGANAITEAEAGSDVFALRSRAVREGDTYRLSGDKSYVTNGPVADVLLVYASTAPEHGYLGVSAFAVPSDLDGVQVGEPFHKMGLESSPISSVYLDDCRVPARYLVGQPGDGARIFHRSMAWERACLFAIYVGAMHRQLEATVAHVKGRRQYRKPLSKLQAVRHRIADMLLRLEGARLLLYRACWALDRGQDHALAICLSKLAVSEAAIRSSLDAIQLHGGGGYVAEVGVEAGLRDAVPATIFSGASEVQRDLVARELGL